MDSKQIQDLVAHSPVVKDLIELKETIWFNPALTTLEQELRAMA